MKRVDIISKVVGRSDTGKPVGGGISIPMGNYALKSDFESLKSMFNDFLEGDDTDSVINRWKDLEAFLNGISEDNTLDSILKAYVTLSGTQTIIGEKNFTGGLKVNGSPIYYDTEKKYWKLEGDLLVTGGVTMYGNEGTFTPSTIMDAIAVDGTTISKDGGVLKVIGSVGGATTLGSLANVGSWADSVAPQDRIMYQAANSSQWVAKNLSDLAVGGVTGDYLPLSGGTLTNTLTIDNSDVGLILHRSGQKTPYIRFGQDTNNEWGELGVYNDGRLVFWPLVSSQGGYNQWNTVWHAGNDGSGSGLDADLLDGLDSSAFFYDKGASNSFDDKIYNGAYRTSSFKPNNAYGYGLVASFRSMETCAQIYFPDRNGEPQFRMQWNSQTSITSGWTALITSSSIGNYNAGSATRLQAYTHDSGDKVLLSGTRSDNTYERCIYDNGWGLMLKRSITNTSGYIATLNDNVASATKLQTPRTIWGQSFDGTGNVDGSLVTANNNFFLSADGGTTQLLGYSKKDGYYSLGYSAGVNGITTHIYGGEVDIYGGTTKVMSVGSSGLVGFYTNNQWLSPAKIMIGRSNTQVYSDWANIGVTDGNLHLDSYNGKSVYINYYSNSNSQGLVVGGGILTTGGVTMYSDARKKTILNHVELSLQQVANAPLIEHYYNSDENKTTHVGSIAQYWADMNDWFCKLDSEGYYTMEIQNAALASAISVARELVKFETETDRRIRLLEEENKRLKEEVEQFKWNIA